MDIRRHKPDLRLLLSVLTALCLIIMFFSFRCKDPSDYEPGDPTQNPPDPPVIILPYQDTIFNGDSIDVLCDWTSVRAAEMYELNIDTTEEYETPWVYLFESPPATIILFRRGKRRVY